MSYHEGHVLHIGNFDSDFKSHLGYCSQFYKGQNFGCFFLVVVVPFKLYLAKKLNLHILYVLKD